MKNRIYSIIQAEGLTPAKFADDIGVQRSNISHILSGRNMPSYDFIYRILTKFPKIDAEWLILGNGSMYKSNLKHEFPNKQTDLFNLSKQMENEPAICNESTEKTDIPKQKENTNKPKFTNVNNAEKIVIFYSDRTFIEFNPSNK